MLRNIAVKLTRLGERLLSAVGLLFLLVTFSPFVSWYAARLAPPWLPSEGEVLVVLSGAAPNEGTGNAFIMDPSTYRRCFMAVVFYRRHPYASIIVSGKGAAAGMRDFLVFNGVPAGRIRLEDEASNTHENAVYSARMLQQTKGRIVLLTSDSHMFRARHCFAREGVRVKASAAADVIERAKDFTARPLLFIAELRETASIVYYWWHGWL